VEEDSCGKSILVCCVCMCVRVYVCVYVCCVCVTCTYSGVELHPSIRINIYSYQCSCQLTGITLFFCFILMRVDFLFKTDSGHPKDMRVTLFTLATPGNPLRYNTHRSAPPVSALAHSRGTGGRQAEGL